MSLVAPLLAQKAFLQRSTCMHVCVPGPDLSGRDDKFSKIQSRSFRPECLQLFGT